MFRRLVQSSRPNYEGKLAFVVEDVDSHRKVFKHELKELGFSVCEFKTHREAYNYISNANIRPDFILLDGQTPCDMNGLDFLDEIKKDGLDIPVITVSSRDGLNRLMCEEGGADASLSKMKAESFRALTQCIDKVFLQRAAKHSIVP